MKNNYSYISALNITKAIFLALVIILPGLLLAQQSPSIQTGVTFQWSDTQTNTNDPATIASVTIDGSVYNTFVVPTGYEMTRLGPDGHSPNRILENGTTLANSSNVANWNTIALSAFQDKNNNHYFTSNRNGRNICNNFAAVSTTDAQKQSIFYNPAIPANEGGVLAVTERNVNNCFHIAVYGTTTTGIPNQFLGETFVRPTSTQWGPKFPPNQAPNANSDYWKTERVVENNGTIGIALFYLSDIVPTGSKITRIEFNASSGDHGDGKIFLLQKYAVDQQDIECINGVYNGNVDQSNNVPENSTYSLLSGPTPAGQSFTFNTNGSYTFVPSFGFTGDVTFEYEVCLPAPNTSVCDQATVTLSYVDLPLEPQFAVACGSTNDDFTISITSPIGTEYEYSIDNGNTFQVDPNFNGLSEGNYNLAISNIFNDCISYNTNNPIVLDNLELTGTITDVLCESDTNGTINITVSGGTSPYTFAWSNSETSEDLSNLSDGTYTVTVTDINGCTISDSYEVSTVIDTTPPTITCPAAITNAVADANCEATTVALGTPTTGDNCSVASVTNDAPAAFPLGTTTVTWTVTDGAGLQTTCTQAVTVIDTTPPTITCPADITNAVADANCEATTVNLGTPTTADNCSVADVSNDAPAAFPLGTTTVTWTVTDGAGLQTTCTQDVTVIDTTPPTITCPAAITNAVADANCEATTVVLGTPITADNCSVASVTNDAPAAFPLGTTTVTWTVTDGAGLQTSCTQAVTVIDNINPVFVETLPTDETVECSNVPDTATLTATDPCGDVDVIFTETRTDGSCLYNYSLERKWVATDQNGLITTHIQTITVVDTKAPEPTTIIEPLLSVNCENIPEIPTIIFTDNCSDNVTEVFEETNSFDENNPSDYEIVRTWTVSDGCNNSKVFTQTITVTLNDFVTSVSERACSDNGTINLDDYLENNQSGGNWIVIEGSARLNGSIFDPENVVLGNYKFSYTISKNGCLNTTEVNIEVHDECIVLPCGREDVIISKVITPNGDTHNEFFTISGVETCGFTVELQIFNRWGAKIYDNSNYQNNWNGFAHNSSVGRADKVPNGTYFYIINLKNSGLEPFAKAFYVGTK